MDGFFSISISDKKMAKVMYAILITKSKLVSCHHLGLEQYTRKQNGGNNVDIIIDINKEQVNYFEELSGVIINTSIEFQGEMKV